MKKCNKCLIEKPLTDFGKESRAKNGHKPRCKKCTNIYYNSIMKGDIKDKKKETQKKYYKKNKSEILKKREVYYCENKKKIINRNKLYIRRRKLENPKLRTLSSFRTLVKRMINNTSVKTFDYLGYSFEDLILSLGRLPIKGEEDIDHKVPISWFKEGTEMYIVFDLSNLQNLCSKKNRQKGNRFSHPISEEYFNKIKPFIKEKYITKIKTIKDGKQ